MSIIGGWLKFCSLCRRKKYRVLDVWLCWECDSPIFPENPPDEEINELI